MMSISKILATILAGLCLSACSYTSSPNPPKTEPEIENQKESQVTSPDAAESQTKEAQEKSQTHERSVQPMAEPGSVVDAENINKARTPPADEADARLAEARENLQTSRETESRIAYELEQLKKSGSASPEAIEDYEAYLSRVRSMTVENRKIVEQMEAAYNRYTPVQSNSKSTVSNKLDKIYEPNIPEEDTMDDVAALDKELNESLAKFDDRLLKEMETIRAESAKKLQDLAQEAADAAKRLRDQGVQVDTSGSASSREADDQKKDSQTGREAGTAGGTADTETTSEDGSRKEGKEGAADDRKRVEYEDDDIVARQLRQAAEEETDPELKEKLWKEYEEYKKSR